MKIKLLFSVILLSGLFFGFGTVVSAQVAELYLKKGLVKIIRGDDVQIINKRRAGLPLFNGDHLQTGANSKAKIILKFSKEVIQLSSRSFFEVDDVNAVQSKIALLTGKGQFKIPKKKLTKKRKKPRFKVRTVTALIGVKGTEFVMGTGNEQTSLLTLSGEVTMAPVSAPDIEVTIPQNQASTVVQGAAPTKPVTVPPETRANIVSSDSTETFKQVSFPKAVSIEKAKKKKKAAKKKEEKKKEEKKKEDAKKDEKKDSEKKSSEKKDTDKKEEEKKDDEKADDKGDTKENEKKLNEDEPKAEEEPEAKAEGDPADDEEGDSVDSKAGSLADDEKGDSASALTDGSEESDIKGAEFDETEPDNPEIAETEIEEPEVTLDELIDTDVMDQLEDVVEEVVDVDEPVVTEDDVEDVIEDVEDLIEDVEETAAETETVIEIKISRCDDVNVICP